MYVTCDDYCNRWYVQCTCMLPSEISNGERKEHIRMKIEIKANGTWKMRFWKSQGTIVLQSRSIVQCLLLLPVLLISFVELASESTFSNRSSPNNWFVFLRLRTWKKNNSLLQLNTNYKQIHHFFFAIILRIMRVF